MIYDVLIAQARSAYMSFVKGKAWTGYKNLLSTPMKWCYKHRAASSLFVGEVFFPLLLVVCWAGQKQNF